MSILKRLNQYVEDHGHEHFKKIAIKNKIILTKEAIKQLEEDFQRVQTDWGKSVIAEEIDELKTKLSTLEKGDYI